ncbi:YeeE/YedE thiosulfate transporter family protein [Selenihalanaerobacter shriftii]|uniref:Uncharacterized protein n=1 Tax=Selenihalanaerobacter shriftii TaxID=142842 RepID=A0A1T4JUH6_9FIRM|nr:YeeE/YedE thiosulfate transporter family protein [Selenihalanaerobacter shriftii]SJZ33788.1 hypothetical protein SAMN02745118_00419 [Selenihalanaerobacter shriftii]
MKLDDENFSLLNNNWPYWLGGILLAILNIIIFVLNDKPWGVTTTFTLLGAKGLEVVGIDVLQWSYISNTLQGQEIISYLLKYQGAILNLGIVAGALLSILLANQFRIRPIYKWKQGLTALFGGILMGYGARIAGGCNIGSMLTGIASMSLHGWIFTLFLIIGVYIGSKIIRTFII